jgi:enoyl-CoA hydratase/carnithine racemase
VSHIIVTEYEGWATVRIDRPDKRNALDQTGRLELAAALTGLQGRARALVLTGSQRWFCCGADLKERARWLAEGKPDTAGQEGIDLALAIKNFPGVVIAAVNGLALGFGVNLVNCCDLALAADMAQLGLPELRSASYASMAAASTFLSGASRKRLAWMIFNTDPIDAYTARDWGLVNEVTPASELEARTAQLARHIATFDAAAIAETKAALGRIPEVQADWRVAMLRGQDVTGRIKARIAGAPVAGQPTDARQSGGNE